LVAGVQSRDGTNGGSIIGENHLRLIVDYFEIHFPMDIRLIEEFIVPLLQHLEHFEHLRDTIRVMRVGDSMPKQVKSRDHEVSQQVRYKIGQVFQHKRHRYYAVITGWDVECGETEVWMARMRVHELSRGRHQSFYHVLADDKSVRYVAEENILIREPDIPHNLMTPKAGKHFKRWNQASHRFISNIRDEYPFD